MSARARTPRPAASRGAAAGASRPRAPDGSAARPAGRASRAAAGALLRRLLAIGDWIGADRRPLRRHRGDRERPTSRRSSGRRSSARSGSSSSSSTASTTTTTAGSATAPSTSCRPLISASALGDARARRAAGAEPRRRRSPRRQRDPGRRRWPSSAASSRARVLRFLWHRLTGRRHRDRDRPARGRRPGRPPARHPPRDPPALVGYLSAQPRTTRRRSCRGSARSPTSRRSRASTTSSG